MSQDLTPGAPIRIIGGSYFGSLAHIANLPVELCNLETESNAKVLEAKLLDGRQVIIPRANVELIEE